MHPATGRGSGTFCMAPTPAKPAPDDPSTLYPALVDADDRGDAEALARLAWVLFAAASTAEQARHEAGCRLKEFRVAAQVVIAGEGSPASLALLRTLLARYGWLPPRDTTPLQVLATPG